MNNDLLTTKEVANYLRVSLYFVYALIKNDNLKAVSVNMGKKRHHWRIKRNA